MICVICEKEFFKKYMRDEAEICDECQENAIEYVEKNIVYSF